jgi:hypothetical protein
MDKFESKLNKYIKKLKQFAGQVVQPVKKPEYFLCDKCSPDVGDCSHCAVKMAEIRKSKNL